MDKNTKEIVKNVNDVEILHMVSCRDYDVIEGMYKGEKFKVIDCGDGEIDVSYKDDNEDDTDDNKLELVEVLKYMGCVSDDDD